MTIYKIELDNKRILQVAYKNINPDKMIIFLPGTSGNAMSERFDYIDKIGLETNHSVLRMDFQFQQYHDESLCIKDCVKDFITVLEYIKHRDINTLKELIVIAKSFGCLVYHLSDVKANKAILIAPYMHIKENDLENMDYVNKKLSELKNDERYIKKELLKQNPHLILHGVRDKIMSIENSEKIANINNNYSIIRMDTDHSFNEEETQKKVIRESKKFLING